MNKCGYSIQAEGSDILNIDIYDVIGEGLFLKGVTARDVLDQLRSSTARTIRVRINSAGGMLNDGKAIYNLLRDQSGKGVHVDVRVDGMAASSASLIAMAGDTVGVAANAFIMIHETTCVAAGDSNDHAKIAQLLQIENTFLAEAYASASARRGKGKTVDAFLAAMAQETYFTASEAVAWGLADSVAKSMGIAAQKLEGSHVLPGFGLVSNYESLSVQDRVRLRDADGGEEVYQSLRASWERRGRPKAAAGALRYEAFTPDELARLRSEAGGEERYQALRAEWESRGCPRSAA